MTQTMTETTEVTSQSVIDAIMAGLKAGADNDDWDAPEMQLARDLTAKAGSEWGFAGWHDAAVALRHWHRLGGVAYVEPNSRTTVTRGSGCNAVTLSADMRQASAPIYIVDEDGEIHSTPFHVADARHNWDQAFDLIDEWDG